jgi:hypothetical protein
MTAAIVHSKWVGILGSRVTVVASFLIRAGTGFFDQQEGGFIAEHRKDTSIPNFLLFQGSHSCGFLAQRHRHNHDCGLKFNNQRRKHVGTTGF